MRDKRGAYFDVDGFLHIAPDYSNSLLATVIVSGRMSPAIFLSIYRRVSTVYVNGRRNRRMRTRMERAIRNATPSTQSTGGSARPSGSLLASLTPISRLECKRATLEIRS